MRLYFTPTTFQNIAKIFHHFRWRLLLWSALSFTLFLITNEQITQLTPITLVWLSLFILFFALQLLVLSAFIFFFRSLPSQQTKEPFWMNLYNLIEWCEALIFTFLLPLPTLIFCFVLILRL